MTVHTSTSCTDFVTWGVAEDTEDGGLTYDAVQKALLPHQPRRAIVSPILLTSNNTKKAAFVTPTGLCSVAESSHVAAHSSDEDSFVNSCTDFVLHGYAEYPESEIPLAKASMSLLYRSEGRKALPITSNNNRCEHFVVNGFCSAPLTSSDVLWMEKVAGAVPGSLFKNFREATREPDSCCEYPYDPMRRFASMCSTGGMRTARGAKSIEHVENLRKSNPLIHPAAWHDWDALYEKISHSRFAAIHQQALITRALHAHARLTATAAREKQHAHFNSYVYAGVPNTRNHHNGLKRQMHLGRLKSIDELADGGRGERSSSDSVIAFLEPRVDVSPAQADTSNSPSVKTMGYSSWVSQTEVADGAGVGTPPAKMPKYFDECAGERSPVSVATELTGQSRKDFEKELAFEADFPLPAPASEVESTKSVAAVDHALHDYKVVSGPGWF